MSALNSILPSIQHVLDDALGSIDREFLNGNGTTLQQLYRPVAVLVLRYANIVSVCNIQFQCDYMLIRAVRSLAEFAS